jgi:hypothetical protein
MNTLESIRIPMVLRELDLRPRWQIRDLGQSDRHRRHPDEAEPPGLPAGFETQMRRPFGRTQLGDRLAALQEDESLSLESHASQNLRKFRTTSVTVSLLAAISSISSVGDGI